MLKATQSPEPSIGGAISMYDKQSTSIASELRIIYACTTIRHLLLPDDRV